MDPDFVRTRGYKAELRQIWPFIFKIGAAKSKIDRRKNPDLAELGRDLDYLAEAIAENRLRELVDCWSLPVLKQAITDLAVALGTLEKQERTQVLLAAILVSLDNVKAKTKPGGIYWVLWHAVLLESARLIGTKSNDDAELIHLVRVFVGAASNVKGLLFHVKKSASFVKKAFSCPKRRAEFDDLIDAFDSFHKSLQKERGWVAEGPEERPLHRGEDALDEIHVADHPVALLLYDL